MPETASDNPFDDRLRARIEDQTRVIGRALLGHLRAQRPRPWQKRYWDDRIMDWAMRDEAVKVRLFRFVDVLPMLKTDHAVIEHLHEYLGEVRDQLPRTLRAVMAVARPDMALGRGLAAAARSNVQSSARRFIAGANVAEVLRSVERLRHDGRGYTLDLLGEAVINDVEAAQHLEAYLEMLRGVSRRATDWAEQPRIDQSPFGPLPRTNLSIKLSAMDSHFDPIDWRGTIERAAVPLRRLLRTARDCDAFLNIDMESYACKDLTQAVFRQVLAEDEFRDVTNVGIVAQAYLRDSLADMQSLLKWTEARGTPIWVRLVKGAYWDYETIHAGSEGWPVPVYQKKRHSDANYERLTRFLIEHHQWLHPQLASHNVRSLAHGMAVAQQLGLDPAALELQMLYGMGEPIQQAVAEQGYRVRVYMPYGELIPGMAYLVRRLLENTSNDSFLRISSDDDASADALLVSPGKLEAADDETPDPQRNIALDQVKQHASHAPEFFNEPLTDFSITEHRAAMQQAIEQVRAEFGHEYPLNIQGQAVRSLELLDSVNPCHTKEIVGRIALATVSQTDEAVAAAHAAWPAWRKLPVEQRADSLRALAAAMRRRRFELAAWIVLECGKPWREADADVAEAIDFCDFYAEQAMTLFLPEGVDFPGEQNRWNYLPRGVTAVISPWNFPLAILTGMTAAALVTGNTVVMKPAEQSSVIAAKLMELFQEIALPPGVVNFLPGRGETAGARLVEHPQVAMIAFTGSRQVGLLINAAAADASNRDDAARVKQVVTEMGGKNGLIIDEDADLDEAVLGVVQSAFGFQGQKCSACSRAIVLRGVHEPFIRRLAEATRSLHVGPAEDPASHLSAVIDDEAQAKCQQYIELGRQTGREVLAVDVAELATEGTYVGPHIFGEVPADARLAQEEVFGPVLAVIKVEDLDEAIQVANDTDYALTAGIYSRSPVNLDRARHELIAGNVYLNRTITGALVGRQPFGGFRMSGTGTKQGGADYLLQFLIPRCVTENTMRRGFAPSGGEE